MFDYTKAALDKTIKDFKKIIFITALCTQIFSIIYLAYTLISKTGIFWINLILLILSVGSFVFFLYKLKKEEQKPSDVTIKRVFSFSKLTVKLFNLGIVIYGFYTAAATVSPITIIVTVLMIICWILQILFEVVAIVVGHLKQFFTEAFQADVATITKPIRETGNFFKRLFGKEVEETAPTKTQALLEKRIAEQKEEKQKEKLAEKERKKKEKEMKKEAKKTAKRNPAPDLSEETAVSENEN